MSKDITYRCNLCYQATFKDKDLKDSGEKIYGMHWHGVGAKDLALITPGAVGWNDCNNHICADCVNAVVKAWTLEEATNALD